MQDTPIYRFGDFTLDVTNRQIMRGDKRLDLSARYFNALVLLVQQHGQLVDKDRFFREVWDDVVVSDSALTQCIKDIRRLLGDDATAPRFIQTVPRHGYRFIAEVGTDAVQRALQPTPQATPEADDEATTQPPVQSIPPVALRAGVLHTATESRVSKALSTTFAGTAGGAVAGILGGLLYGYALAYSPVQTEVGTASVLLVLMSVTGLLGTIGGFGIGAGIAVADYATGNRAAWRVVGAVLGGMLVGGSVKLLGIDAFNLFFGRTPAGITGGTEGAGLGLAVGLGAYFGGGLEAPLWWKPAAAAAATGAAAGVLIALSGGHLMAGSLDLLAQSFSDSRLTLDAIGRYFGEVRFGQTTQIIVAAIEGFIFAGGVTGALVASRRPKQRVPTGQ